MWRRRKQRHNPSSPFEKTASFVPEDISRNCPLCAISCPLTTRKTDRRLSAGGPSFSIYHRGAPHSLRFLGERTLQFVQQCLALLGHGLKRPLLKGRAQSSLLEKLCKDFLPALGKEAHIAVKCVIIILTERPAGTARPPSAPGSNQYSKTASRKCASDTANGSPPPGREFRQR